MRYVFFFAKMSIVSVYVCCLSFYITFAQINSRYCLCPSETQLVAEERLPLLQQCDIKVEPVLEDKEIKTCQQVKEEQVDYCISPDMEADTFNDANVRLPKVEPKTDCELFPSPSAVTVSVNTSLKDERNESYGSSSPPESDGVEVVVELEEPLDEEKSCRFCGKIFKRYSDLIRHVGKSHNGRKAFKCLECSKEFEQRYNLVQHLRIHMGEKPFSCDFCGKTFAQNSRRIVHMRVHTGEKPYFCNKCGKSFSTSKHLKFCKMHNDLKIQQD